MHDDPMRFAAPEVALGKGRMDRRAACPDIVWSECRHQHSQTHQARHQPVFLRLVAQLFPTDFRFRGGDRPNYKIPIRGKCRDVPGQFGDVESHRPKSQDRLISRCDPGCKRLLRPRSRQHRSSNGENFHEDVGQSVPHLNRRQLRTTLACYSVRHGFEMAPFTAASPTERTRPCCAQVIHLRCSTKRSAKRSMNNRTFVGRWLRFG